MIKSSLLEILRTFNTKDLSRFDDFVNSPYHNRNKNVINLFAEVKKFAPGFTDEDLAKGIIWEKIFPDKKYNYGIMKNLIHDLTKLCESFILLEKYQNNSLQSEYDLIEALGGRNIQKITLNKIDQFEKKLKNELEQNSYTSLDDFLLVSSHYNFTKENFIHIYNLKLDKSDATKLASEYAFYFFLIVSFKLINNTLSHELQGNRSIEKTLVEKFFIKLEEHSILEDLLLNENKNHNKLSKMIICFYYMYKAISSNGSIEAYDKFKSLLKENIDLFSGFEIQNLNNCRTVCQANLKLPYLKSSRESLDWFKFLMEKNALLERNGLLTHHSLTNLVSHAAALKETEFAEKIVEKYSVKLPEDTRDNTYNYCMALINFAKHEFGKSLENLSRINNEKLMLKYQAKVLSLKIYYELNDYESFEYSFDSFVHFKKRNKLSNEARSIAFDNFGNYVKALFKQRNHFDEFGLEKLRNDVRKNLNKEQRWILEKLDDIERNMKQDRQS